MSDHIVFVNRTMTGKIMPNSIQIETLPKPKPGQHFLEGVSRRYSLSKVETGRVEFSCKITGTRTQLGKSSHYGPSSQPGLRENDPAIEITHYFMTPKQFKMAVDNAFENNKDLDGQLIRSKNELLSLLRVLKDMNKALDQRTANLPEPTPRSGWARISRAVYTLDR